MDKELHERVTELETRLAFSEDQIEQLDQVIYQQQQKLDQLSGLCEAMRQSLVQAQDQGSQQIIDTPPPHY